MTQMRAELHEVIDRLPEEKMYAAFSYVMFLEANEFTGKEIELAQGEEAWLRSLMDSDDFITHKEMLSRIKEASDD